MPNLKGTKTEKNLLIAFAGESQARNRYTFYASAAKKDGLVQISNIFTETAAQEKEHAERLFKFLEGGDLTIQASFPAGVIGKTSQNLADAAAGEDHEWKEMYPDFAKIAQEEGFSAIAVIFTNIAVAEKQHAKRFHELKANLDAGKVFKKDKSVIWRCLNCGYIFEGTEAPKACPACAHPQDYFEVLGENW
ncbi:rubrerythrin [Treponema primitia ZAS-2]|uniref:Rubrerythrin n=1 Tax=Treponema primitia (strain ATCC BAA-887 / DSM 12427 / ZAS-2) TaxID=545694 RepID=F5YPF8_TREPZ|nr:rubrerythrin family protein [Treponema primitia]AEF83762.1 rubrerythrin [Treponema primitia ZAS-2]